MDHEFAAAWFDLPLRNLEIEESLRIGGQIKAFPSARLELLECQCFYGMPVRRRHKKQLTKEDRSTYNDSDNHNSC